MTLSEQSFEQLGPGILSKIQTSGWLVVNFFFVLIIGTTGTDREVSLDMKHGVEAKSYEDVSQYVHE